MGVRKDFTPAVPGEGAATEQGYVAYKRAKIDRGLEQSRDRSAMIPVDQLLRALSLDW